MLKLKRIGTTEQKTRTKKNNFIKDKDGNQKTSFTTIKTTRIKYQFSNAN